MKIGFIALFALLFLTVKTHAQDKNFYIFLSFGQSNMEGFPGIEDQDKGPVDPRFQVLAAVDFPELHREKGHWYAANPPLARPGTGIGPSDYFGRTLIAHLPPNVKVGMINVSVAGCKIEMFEKGHAASYLTTAPSWMKGIAASYGDDPYRRLVEMAKLAQKDGVVKGILLHQGESNTNNKDWPNKVKSVYDNLIHDLHLNSKRVPLLAGEFVGADQGGACASMNSIIDDLPKTIPNSYVISSVGCPARPDHLHFTPAGYRELGKRYGEKMLSLLGFPIVSPSSFVSPVSVGDNTFTNPVLYGDYPDPDIIRVGGDFYLVTTTFVSVPGLEILHSKDLIHWKIVGYAAKTLDADPKYSLIDGSRYAQGVWAPSLRYHRGTFYIVDNIQNAGTVVFRAVNPAGPWTMNRLNGYLFDPGLLFDDDGTPLVYNGTGGRISVAVLNPDLRRVVSNTPAFTLPGNGGEGSHAYKLNGMYYVFNAVYAMDATISCARSKNRGSPFVNTTVCANKMPWHAPHQGGIVQLPNGDWWGFSLADTGPIGRTMWIGPVTWKDDWPYFGDPSAPGFPVTSPKPKLGKFPITAPPNSDNFSGSKLALQWQWNHNPDDAQWSLSERKGFLRLKTQTAPNLTNARNTLTLRTEGPQSTGTVKIDTRHLQPGDRAGLCLLEQNFGYLAVYREGNRQKIVRVVNKNGDLKAPSEDITETISTVPETTLWLQARCDFKANMAQFFYSTDGRKFMPLGGDFPMHFTLATFQGERYGIFNYNPAGSGGWLDVDSWMETSPQTP